MSEEGVRDRCDAWPTDRTVYLTLDLECDYGTALDENRYDAARRTDDLARILERHDAGLSCFLQTAVLEEAPAAVEQLVDADVPVEFHAHSHTHPPRSAADLSYEVAESVGRVRDRFGTDPVGYRFPDGARGEGGYAALADHDVPFSASLFPMHFPGRFDNSSASLYPFRHDSGVLELPFTVYSARLRVPVALSYLKLLGRPYAELVARRPPSTIVFDMHMHDLFVPPAYDGLSWPYRRVYARNGNDGAAVFERFLAAMDRQDYDFGLVSDLYRETEAVLA